MKKFLAVLMIVFLAGVLFPALVKAEDDDKISTMISIDETLSGPENGDSYHDEQVLAYFHKNWLGIGGYVQTIPEQNYLTFKPFATINQGPWHLIGGYETKSTGADYLHFGGWYAGPCPIQSLSKLSIFLDVRNYWGISDESKNDDYLDSFLELEYPLDHKFSLGIDLIYDSWWHKDREWYKISPYVGYQLTDVTRVYLKAFRSWDDFNNDISYTDGLRISLKFFF